MSNESDWIQVDNNLDTTKAAPSGASAGIEVPQPSTKDTFALKFRAEKSVTAGTPTFQIVIYGFIKGYIDANGEYVETNKWTEIHDTGVVSNKTDITYRLTGLKGFTRIATAVLTNGGTGPLLSNYIHFETE